MNHWWSQLQVREKAIVSVLAALLMMVVMDTLLLTPWLSHKQSLADRMEQAREDSLWMQENRFRLQSSGPVKQPFQGNLLSTVDRVVKQNKLSESLQKLSPSTDNTVRARFENINLNTLFKLIAQLDSMAIEVTDFRLAKADKAGFGHANLVITASE